MVFEGFFAGGDFWAGDDFFARAGLGVVAAAGLRGRLFAPGFAVDVVLVAETVSLAFAVLTDFGVCPVLLVAIPDPSVLIHCAAIR